MRALFVVGAMFLAQPVFAQSNEKYTGSNVDVRRFRKCSPKVGR